MAIDRVKRYSKAGADLLFIEAPNKVDELEIIAKQVKLPLLLNQLEGGRTPLISMKKAKKMSCDSSGGSGRLGMSGPALGGSAQGGGSHR